MSATSSALMGSVFFTASNTYVPNWNSIPLETIIADEPIGILKVAKETGYPQHKVRYSLRVLEKAGLVEPSDDGAVTTAHTAGFVMAFDEELTTVATRVDALKADVAAIEL